MEEKKITEEESLELISRMIRSTKQNMKMGQGNQMLYFGYFTAFLSFAIYGLIYFTEDGRWSFLWFLMFAFWGILSFAQRNKKPEVVTYMDKAVSQVWKVIGAMFILTTVMVIALLVVLGTGSFILLMPLSLLYVGLGVSITGIIVREPWMIYSPLFSYGVCFYMLQMLIIGHHATLTWILLFGISFLISEVLPGHIINHKSRM